jgi:hypothetical protein
MVEVRGKHAEVSLEAWRKDLAVQTKFARPWTLAPILISISKVSDMVQTRQCESL